MRDSSVSHCQVFPSPPLLNLHWALQVVPAWGRCFQKVQRLDHSNARQQLCSCWMWCDLPLLHPRPFRERPERYCSNHHAERHQQLVGSNLCSQIFGSLFVSERHHFVRLCFWCIELCTFEFPTEFLLSLHHGSDFWPRCDFRSSDSSTVYELRSTWRDGKSPRSCEFCCDYYSWTWSKDFSPSVSCMSDIQSSFNLERCLEWIRVKLLVVACGCLWLLVGEELFGVEMCMVIADHSKERSQDFRFFVLFPCVPEHLFLLRFQLIRWQSAFGSLGIDSMPYLLTIASNFFCSIAVVFMTLPQKAEDHSLTVQLESATWYCTWIAVSSECHLEFLFIHHCWIFLACSLPLQIAF